MGEIFGFLKTKRERPDRRPVKERLKDYKEVEKKRPDEKTSAQSGRCMDCGTPFCNNACPLGNYIPEWNDTLFAGKYEQAYKLLSAVNPLPEITGRVCPAVCEYACVLGINEEPVTIRENELYAAEKAFELGIVKPEPVLFITGKNVLVIGSGPAGLSAAYELNRKGHNVTVMEKDEEPGGFLRYGIPDFKLEKYVLDRRIDIWKQEGIKFITGVEAGGPAYPAEKIFENFDAVCVASGCRVPRNPDIPGRELKGIYPAADYLAQANRRVAGQKINKNHLMDAGSKNVIIIGGGDTGSDCAGTANRQGAKSVTQVEIMPMPPEKRPKTQPWPAYPSILRTSTSHEEGVKRKWGVMTKKFTGKNGVLTGIEGVECRPAAGGKKGFEEIPGTEFKLPADTVILSMGFVSPEKGLIEKLGLTINEKGRAVKKEGARPPEDRVFIAGDVSRGPSLVVWAIAEGKKAAVDIDEYLKEGG